MIREAETDTMQFALGRAYITRICAITELRKTKVIDNKANEIIRK